MTRLAAERATGPAADFFPGGPPPRADNGHQLGSSAAQLGSPPPSVDR